jgi:glutamyl-tRNA reductase
MRTGWTFLGISHQGTDLDTRGRLTLEPHVDEVYRRVLATADEAFVLHTCNRSEIYAFGVVEEVAPALQAIFAEVTGTPPAVLGRYAFTLDGQDVVRHLFLVAAGLEAQIVGETQILGQIKQAFNRAAAAEAVGKEVSMLVQGALAAARRAHRETGMDEHPVSVGSAAVALAKRSLGSLSGRSVLLIGAGEVAELCCQHLREAADVEIVIANRTRQRAARLAKAFGGTSVGWAQIDECLAKADIVLSSTGAPHEVLYARDIKEAMRRRGGRRMVLVDLSLPRDIEPSCAALPGVEVSNLDDLAAISQAQRQERLREAEAAEAIVLAAAADFERRRCERQALPLIRSLRGKAEEVRDKELRRALHRLGDVPETERQVIEQLASRIVNKLLNEPTLALKECALREDGESCLRLAADIFHLDGPDWPQEA